MNPKTPFTRAAKRDSPKLTQYEATTRGAVTVSQKCPHPPDAVLRNSAENGTSTIRLR